MWVAAGIDRELELGSNPVIGGNQQGILVARRLKIEQAAKASELGVRSGPGGRTGQWPDRLDQGISGID